MVLGVHGWSAADEGLNQGVGEDKEAMLRHCPEGKEWWESSA